MNIKSILLAACVCFLTTVCSGQNVKQPNNNVMSKAIVIFFSHAGDNYSVGNIEVGNTKIVADYITEMRKIRHPFDDGVMGRKGIEY